MPFYLSLHKHRMVSFMFLFWERVKISRESLKSVGARQVDEVIYFEALSDIESRGGQAERFVETVGSLSDSDDMLMATGFLSVSVAWCVALTPSSITALYCCPPVCSHLEPDHSSSAFPSPPPHSCSCFCVACRPQLSESVLLFKYGSNFYHVYIQQQTLKNLFKITSYTFNQIIKYFRTSFYNFWLNCILASCRKRDLWNEWV